MKTNLYFVGMFALIILHTACKSDSPQKSGTVETPEAAAPPAASGVAVKKPESFIYLVLYNDLRLRDQPGQTSAVSSKLRLGELVTGTGETSMQEETVELRGIPMKSHYYKVRNAAGKDGWVFGAAVQVIYAGTSTGSPGLEKLQTLSSFLNGLNAKKLDSGKKAWEYVRKMPAENNPAANDAAFVLLESFLRRMELEGDFYALTDKMTWEDADFEAIHNNRFDMNKYPITKQLEASGFALVQAEGSVFPVYDWVKLQQHFASRVSPTMKAYIEQSVMEQKMTVWSDGGIVVPLEELADRAVFWEKFNRDNPWFPYRLETEESQRWLTNALVLGADNTPVFDHETQEVSPDFRKMWEYVQKKYPGTAVASRVKAFADLCASEGWKRTPKVEESMGKLQM
ncbi:MAG: SH3 domain-containing protein [Saprospiraceae bacterium]|nr:SH3 domain-containing protein [Saprospiraceae bacterium]